MLNGWINDIHREIGRGIRQVRADHGIALVIPCAGECGDEHVETFDKKLPVEIVRKKLMQRGWNLAKQPICSPCSNKAKEQREPKPMATAPVTPPDRSDAAKKAKRMIYMALEDYYDEAKKTYRPGHTDASISEATGASVEFVKRIREEDFGPLAEPGEIVEFRATIAAFGERIGNFETDARTLKGALDITAEQLRSGLANLTAQIDRIAKRNGWQ